MPRSIGGWILVILIVSPGLVWAQPPRGPRTPTPMPTTGVGDPNAEKKESPLPPAVLTGDTKFRQVYLDFIKQAERLGDEFEKAKQHDKAKAAYEEVLRLTPENAAVKKKLDDVKLQEATQYKKIVEIQANKDWQDTGVVVLAGKPVQITSTGAWTFTISKETTADGVPIPKELKDFNLGALVGIIQTTETKEMKPFVVGSDLNFVAEKTGKLLLKMYSGEPKDNKGKLVVTIQGSFEMTKP